MNRRLAVVSLLLAVVTMAVVGGQQQGPNEPDRVPGELIVKFARAASAARRSNVLLARAAARLRRFDALDMEHVRIPTGLGLQATLDAFRATADVESVQPNYIRRTVGAAPPNDPLWLSGNLWGLERIQARSVWTTFSPGNGSVVVADIDTGVNYLHPDLAANMWRNPGEVAGNGVDDDHNGFVDDVYGIDVRNGDSDPMDDHGHGTHTAGTIAGIGNNGIGVAGVNWNAKILACKFLGPDGSGSDADAIACLNYVVALKQRGVNIRVTNNSWGGPRGNGPVPSGLKSAFDTAGAAGILNVVAAGNDGVNIDTTPFDPASLTSTSILTVAASDQSDARASFSNYGTTGVDLAAPGVSIDSTYLGTSYATSSGTSMAAPHVAGAAALLAAIKPTLTASDVKTALMSNVDHLPAWTSLVGSGGRLNILTTAGAVAVASVPNVTVTAPTAGTSVPSGTSVPISVAATDPDGISSVSIYADGQLVGTVLNTPYTVNWSSTVIGSHSLTAVAVDSLGVTGSSTAVTVTVSTVAASAAATFVRTDLTTSGTWRGAYGADGWLLPLAGASLPSYAQVSVTGASTYAWTGLTTDARALQAPAPAPTTQRAATTWYGGTFEVDVTLTDGGTHQVGLYLLDWDATSRAERVDVLDGASGAVLDTRTVSGFHDGQYLVWAVQGHVRLRVTQTGAINAVVSGVFFDAAGPPNTPPTVQLVAPATGATFAAPATIGLSATAADADGSVVQVAFYAGGQVVGTSTATSNPRTATWTTGAGGTYTLTAVATDNRGATTTSAPVTITVTGGTTSAATYVRTDLTTSGTWRGAYGADGWLLPLAGASLPSYAQVSVTGASTYAWTGLTTDARALQAPAPAPTTQRAATTWYGGTFEVDVTLTDGGTHQVGLYLLDWDATSRAERVDVLDGASGAVLDTRTVSGFHDGQYLVWAVQGHVRLRVTQTGAINAVVSGVFFDAAGPPNTPPTVQLVAPATGATFAAPATIGLSATAADADGSVVQVAFYAGGQVIGTSTATSNPRTATWTTGAGGTYTLTAVATDNRGATMTSAPVTITVTGGTTSAATYVRTDLTTSGTWRGAYGADGWLLPLAGASLPSYAQVSVTGASTYAWTGLTTDARALQAPAPAPVTQRAATTWYGGTFEVDVTLTDGGTHQVGLYLLDWDATSRAERVDVLDGASGAVLDTRTVSGFHDGQYLVWAVQGHVRLRVTQTGAINAVVGGVFFDAAGPPNTPPTVQLVAPATGATFAAPATIGLSATAADADGSVVQVAFYAGGQVIGTSTATSNPRTATWTTGAGGTYTLTAVATDNRGATMTSAPVTITVTGGTTSAATYVRTDLTTSGTWRGAYGADGWLLPLAGASLPSYAQVSVTGASTYAWTGLTTDARALQAPAPAPTTQRAATTWYGGTFEVDVTLTDGGTHQVGLYLLDWDATSRAERVDVLDGASGAVLDTRTVSGFHDGQYLVWAVQGHVRLRVTQTGAINAVVSGVFFDAAGFAPTAIQPSTITLRLDPVLQMPSHTNPTSPVAAGSSLLMLDQSGFLYGSNGSTTQTLLTRATAPAGVDPVGDEAILNAAANATGNTVIVAFTSSTAPAGVPQYVSPRPWNAWQVLVRYDFNGATLSNPVPLAAFQVNMFGHTGGGLAVLGDGSVLFATGDNGDAGEDGRAFAQDTGNHLSKLLRVDANSGASTVVAAGVRNVQRLVVFTESGQERLTFGDIGGRVSEELNSIPTAALTGGLGLLNFGWGRNADGRAREGTFYVDQDGYAVSTTAVPEAGFVQPIAQFGREGASFVAMSGPASRATSLVQVTHVFADLVSGGVYGILGSSTTPGQLVRRLNLVDTALQPTTLNTLAGGRSDPRLFTFPDGSAGVLLEATGQVYRLTELN